MKQTTFNLITFEIRDGENSYNDYTIFKKNTTNMSENEIISEVYGYDFGGNHNKNCVMQPREVIVYSIQEITREEADTLQKLYVTYSIIH